VVDLIRTILELLAKAFAPLWRRLSRDRALDHTTISRGWYTRAYGQWSHIFVVVACATSRPFRHSRDITPRAAFDFIEDVFPGSFSSLPVGASGGVISFEVRDDPQSIEVLRAVRCYEFGLVEFLLRVPMTVVDERVTIDAVEVGAPVYRLSRALRGGAYQRLYGLRSHYRRIDWFAAVSTSFSSDTGSRSWDELTFPGRVPEGRATQPYPAMGPLALEALKSRKQHSDPTRIVRTVIADLLRGSHWYGVDDAVEDIVQAVRDSCEVQPASSGEPAPSDRR
jgi:hypothetical protein